MRELDDMWRKPTKSGAGGQCFTVRRVGDIIQVMNSNRPGPMLEFTLGEWDCAKDAFIQGEFDAS